MVYGVGTIVPRTLNYLLLTFFYTRVFQQGEYGVVTELYAYAAFLLVLLTFGMETTFFRFMESEKKSSNVYSTSLISLFITSSVFIAFILLFSRPISELIRYSANTEYIIYFGLIIGIDSFTSIPFARLRQQKRAFRFAFLKIINIAVNISLNLFFLWICPQILKSNPDSIVGTVYSPEIGVGYAFISNLIATAVTLILLIPDIFNVKVHIDTALLTRMLKYALPLLVVGLAGMINEVSDKIFLRYLWPDEKTALEQVGIYGASYRLGVLMTLFTQVFRYAAEPFFFAQSRESNHKQVYADVMKYFILFGLLIFLGVTLYIDLVKYFIGSDFREGLHVVPIILMANLFLGIFYNLSIWYKLKNLTRYGAVIALTGATVTVTLNIILIPIMGYTGCAWAHFFCYLVMVLISYFWGRRHLRVNYDLTKISVYVIIALILFFLGYYFTPEELSVKLITNSLYIVVFLLFIYFFERRHFGSIKQ